MYNHQAQERVVFLKKDKERVIAQNRHPWIFSGAIESFSADLNPGDIAHVYSFDKQFLAVAYFHPGHSLCGRILSFEKKPIQEIIREKIQRAFLFRKEIFDPTETNCYRGINAEEDGLPGLIVDYYDGVLVVQISTLGMERLRDLVISSLIKELKPKAIYEKSTASARVVEGLAIREGLLYGDPVQEIVVLENGLSFLVSIVDGQKTGFFLDQREMRKKIGEIAKGRSVLNCFAYSGGFSLYALRGGATNVTSIDSCPVACALSLQNTRLNGFSENSHRILQEDVFSFLKKEDLSLYDLIILDPPAFAKKRTDIESAARAYQKMMEAVFTVCKPNTLLLTSSCSYFVDESLFKNLVFRAASFAQRDVRVLSHHIKAPDHLVSVYHPEGEYLKSLLVLVD